MDIKAIVSENVKRVREQRKLTLDSAADITGVSRSMLAQIERGEVNPTISVIWKIANGYRVSFTSLLEQSNVEPDVILAKDVQPMLEDGGKYINYPTFLFSEEKSFESYRIVIEEDGKLEASAHMNGCEEYITVFDGEVRISVGDSVYTLTEGDSIRFVADCPHSYANIGKGKVKLSMLIYYNE